MTLHGILHAHPDIARVEAFVCDMKGTARGKWMPLPRQIFALDIWVHDVAGAGVSDR